MRRAQHVDAVEPGLDGGSARRSASIRAIAASVNVAIWASHSSRSCGSDAQLSTIARSTAALDSHSAAPASIPARNVSRGPAFACTHGCAASWPALTARRTSSASTACLLAK
jgi:hypothetical protein